MINNEQIIPEKRYILSIGDVIVVKFPMHNPQGHEQEGLRPAIVVGLPQVLGKQRFPSVIVVPLTTYKRQDWLAIAPKLYPKLSKGTANLPANSIVLLDQMRAVDATRIVSYLGSLNKDDLLGIRQSIKMIFK